MGKQSRRRAQRRAKREEQRRARGSEDRRRDDTTGSDGRRSRALASAWTFGSIGLVMLGAGVWLIAPTLKTFDPVDVPIVGQRSAPIVVVGTSIDEIKAELHLQPQLAGTDEFPDGLDLILYEFGDQIAEPDADSAEASAEPDAEPEDLLVALPRHLVRTESVQADAWSPIDSSVDDCRYSRAEASLDELPPAARDAAQDHVFIRYSPTAGCSSNYLSLELDRITAGIYDASRYEVALRLPPIAFYDYDTKEDPGANSVASSGLDAEQCRKTLVMLDTYQLRATDWLGADAANSPLTAKRTQATYYGGSLDRPVGWWAELRRPESGTLAPCVSQGVSVDLERPNSSEGVALAQVVSGFLFGLASGLVIPAVEFAIEARRARGR